MGKGIGYADAVRLLGGKTRTVQVIDKILSGGLLGGEVAGMTGALGLLDAKTEAVRIGHELINGLRERLGGLSRYDRTQRIEAANLVLAITAFFEALDDIDLPVQPKDLRLSRDEQLALAGGKGGSIDPGTFTTSFLAVAPEASFDDTLTKLAGLYEVMAVMLSHFVTGLEVVDRLSETDQARLRGTLIEDLPGAAVCRYEILYRRLAGDVPEFAFWANLVEHRGTRRGLMDLERLLSGENVPAARLRDLARAHRALMDRPIAEIGDVPEGLRFPTLDDAYIDPSFLVGDEPDESNKSDARDDLPRFLSGYLTQTRATETPLVVLGQPGAGKSVLTKVLAARLPTGEFLPVRVPLREVESAATVQEQIEQGIARATGESLSWPALARSAGGALPVVLLDGLDELLQATGAHWSNYLVQVAEFQRREAELERPVAVIVTSRTAVADRVRVPEDGVTLRLAPFTDEQIASWLAVWNAANRGLRPLTLDTVLDHSQLAEQPLLLLMLAIYDADSEALGTGEAISQAELYQQLLDRFARREVVKHRPDLPADRVDDAVERELERLSVTAFAMFNRNRQWVDATDLDRDLGVLAPTQTRRRDSFHAPLTSAEVVIGRFFFVHHAQAVQDQAHRRTYEFLHPTFGEFLIARTIHRELHRLTRLMELSPNALMDGRLYALLSFACLAERSPILEFLDDLAPDEAADECRAIRNLLLRLFHQRDLRTDTTHSSYEPVRLPQPARYAHYTANLMLLAVIYGGQLRASDLFPDGRAVEHWTALVHLWRYGLVDAFARLVSTVNVERIWVEGERDVDLSLGSPSERPRLDPMWLAWTPPGGVPPGGIAITAAGADDFLHDSTFGCDSRDELQALLLEPLVAAFGEVTLTAIATAGTKTGVETYSPARDLIRLWVSRPVPGDPPAVAEAYEHTLVGVRYLSDVRGNGDYLEQLLEQFATDIAHLSRDDAVKVLFEVIALVRKGSVRERELVVEASLALLARYPEDVKIAQLVLDATPVNMPLPLLRSYVTLLELDVEAESVRKHVSRLSETDLAKIARRDPLLVRRARRLFADRSDLELPWPDPASA